MKHILKNIAAILTTAENRRAYLLICSDALVSVLDISALVALLFIVNFYTQPGSGNRFAFLPGYLQNRDSLLLIMVFLVIFCLKNLFAYLVQRAQFRFVYHVASRLSENRLLQYLEGDYETHVSTDSSVFIRKISQQPVEFSQHVLAGIQQIITQLFLIVLTVAAILLFNPRLFLFVLLLLVPPVMVIALIIKKRTRAARAHVRTYGEKTLQYTREALAGFVESNIYNRHPFFLNRYSTAQQMLNRHLAGLQVVQSVPGRLMEVFAVLGFFILLAINKWTGHAGNTDILTIGMFMAAAYKIIPGVVKILNCSGQVRTYDYTIQDLLQQSDVQAAVKKTGERIAIRSLSFQNISFQYGEQNIFTGFSATFKTGDFAGITGISGKGKTTLINLLLGFVKQGHGNVFINDIAVPASELDLYWPAISYIKQEPFLINDSMLKNITLGETRYDPEKLNEVLQATGIQDWLYRFPEGIHKHITENGRNISGGQRQRIAIARALYKNADLIILDEPFNELDEDTEQAMLRHFSGLAAKGKIILLITHNKESLAFCNKTISLDET